MCSPALRRHVRVRKAHMPDNRYRILAAKSMYIVLHVIKHVTVPPPGPAREACGIRLNIGSGRVPGARPWRVPVGGIV